MLPDFHKIQKKKREESAVCVHTAIHTHTVFGTDNDTHAYNTSNVIMACEDLLLIGHWRTGSRAKAGARERLGAKNVRKQTVVEKYKWSVVELKRRENKISQRFHSSEELNMARATSRRNPVLLGFALCFATDSCQSLIRLDYLDIDDVFGVTCSLTQVNVGHFCSLTRSTLVGVNGCIRHR